MSCWKNWTRESEREKKIIKRLLIRCRDPLKRSCFYDEDLVSISKGKSNQQTNKQTRESKSLNGCAWTGGWNKKEEAPDATRRASRDHSGSHKTAIVRVYDETDEKDDVSSRSSDFFIIIHLYHSQSYVYFGVDYHPSTWLYGTASGYTIHPSIHPTIHTVQIYVYFGYHPSIPPKSFCVIFGYIIIHPHGCTVLYPTTPSIHPIILPNSYVYPLYIIHRAVQMDDFSVDHHPSVPPKSYVYPLGTLSSIHMAVQYCIQGHHLSIDTAQSYVYFLGR